MAAELFNQQCWDRLWGDSGTHMIQAGLGAMAYLAAVAMPPPEAPNSIQVKFSPLPAPIESTITHAPIDLINLGRTSYILSTIRRYDKTRRKFYNQALVSLGLQEGISNEIHKLEQEGITIKAQTVPGERTPGFNFQKELLVNIRDRCLEFMESEESEGTVSITELVNCAPKEGWGNSPGKQYLRIGVAGSYNDIEMSPYMPLSELEPAALEKARKTYNRIAKQAYGISQDISQAVGMIERVYAKITKKIKNLKPKLYVNVLKGIKAKQHYEEITMIKTDLCGTPQRLIISEPISYDKNQFQASYAIINGQISLQYIVIPKSFLGISFSLVTKERNSHTHTDSLFEIPDEVATRIETALAKSGEIATADVLKICKSVSKLLPKAHKPSSKKLRQVPPKGRAMQSTLGDDLFQ